MNIRRGDIYYADLSPVVGSEQGGLRPVLIVQNDVGLCLFPTSFCIINTGLIPPCSEPTTGLKSA